MRKYILLSLLLPAMATEAETVHISTPTTSLVLDATEGQTPRFIYYGNALSGSDLANLEASGAPSLNAYPVYGLLARERSRFCRRTRRRQHDSGHGRKLGKHPN